MAIAFCGGAQQPLYVHHVARLAGLSRRTIRHLAATGQLRATKRGVKIWTFDKQVVEAFLVSRGGF